MGDTTARAEIWVNFEDDSALPVEESFNVADWAYNAGVVGTAGRNLTYGVRNSAADNFGPHDEDGNVVGIVLGEDFAFGTLTEQYPVYDNGTAVFSFDINTLHLLSSNIGISSSIFFI